MPPSKQKTIVPKSKPAAKPALISFQSEMERFSANKEKTGWTYIVIQQTDAEKINPGQRKSYRVKGTLDKFDIAQVAILPIKEGGFILPINGAMRKAIQKSAGDRVKVTLMLDNRPLAISEELLLCLEDEPAALAFFQTLTPGHQRYFSKWIESAKTIETRTKRIAMAIVALSLQKDFGQMLRDTRQNP